MDAVAHKADISAPSLYNFFSSRKSLLSSVYNSYMKEIENLIELSDKHENPEKEFQILISKLSEYYERCPFAIKLLIFNKKELEFKNEEFFLIYKKIKHIFIKKILNCAEYSGKSSKEINEEMSFHILSALFYGVFSTSEDDYKTKAKEISYTFLKIFI